MTVERIHPKAPVMLIFIAIFTCLPSCINLSNMYTYISRVIINVATHEKGSILDILLTTSTSYLKDLKVIDTERFCISDHYAITFSITEKVIRKPCVKRVCYNYKKANWNNLNEDLELIN